MTDRILVVDDEAAVRASIVRVLEKRGYSCAAAASSAEARALMEAEPFALVLTDVTMPGESGIELLQHVCTKRPDTAAVMVTGVDDAQLGQSALELGAYGYLLKPFRPNELLINVANALRRRTLEMQTQSFIEKLRRASEEAARANQAKTEFLSRMSHELRTPLTAVLGFGQLLERRKLSPEQHAEAVGHILKAGRHLLGLIDEVLDIARIEEGQLSLSLEPVRIGDVMDEALTLIQPVAEERGIAMDAFGEHANCHVTADRQRLTQVFLNLLSNAVKYNRDLGRVMLSCEQSEGQLTVRVRDEGYGIAPELQMRLFSPFDRLGAEQTGIEGTGLGLALSKRLVEAMGGRLGVESVPGEGSTFWVRLPIVDDPLQHVEKRAEVQTSGGPADLASTILYVEDNVANLRLIEHILKDRPGIRLIPAMQGRLGIELAREHHPDLILLDLNLPDMGGPEVLARLRSDPVTAAVPVVVLSADATAGQRTRLLSAGANAYLSKPFDLDQFFCLLEDTLGPSSD